MTQKNRDRHDEIARRLQDPVRLQAALKKAARDAVHQHALAGRKIAVWRDGQVVWEEASHNTVETLAVERRQVLTNVGVELREEEMMLVTVKSRELQRGMTGAMSGQPSDARKHFLAAAHLELVLASDYEQAGDTQLARRGRISAASCYWRAGETDEAQAIFDELSQAEPQRAGEIHEVIDDLRAGA